MYGQLWESNGQKILVWRLFDHIHGLPSFYHWDKLNLHSVLGDHEEYSNFHIQLSYRIFPSLALHCICRFRVFLVVSLGLHFDFRRAISRIDMASASITHTSAWAMFDICHVLKSPPPKTIPTIWEAQTPTTSYTVVVSSHSTVRVYRRQWAALSRLTDSRTLLVIRALNLSSILPFDTTSSP